MQLVEDGGEGVLVQIGEGVGVQVEPLGRLQGVQGPRRDRLDAGTKHNPLITLLPTAS